MRRGCLIFVCTTLAGAIALPAADATAQPPEFGRCVKRSGGVYENSRCTKTATGTGRFEWEPGPGPKAGFTESASSFKWSSPSRATGVCTGESATGELTGANSVAGVSIVLRGCEFADTFREGKPIYLPCEEPVTLGPLAGELGVIAAGATPEHEKVGLKLSPETGSDFAAVKCGLATVGSIWRGGSVIAPIGTNKMQAKSKLAYKQRGGPGILRSWEQLPASFEGQAPSPLEEETSGEAGGEPLYTPMGWTMSAQLVYEEALEVNSVV